MGLSCSGVFCFFGRSVSRRVGAWQPWSGNSVGGEERFSGEFKGRRKPIKRFISCLHSHKHYSFCCFLINEKPVKKFFLCTTTTTTIHFPRIPPLFLLVLYQPPLHLFSSIDKSVIRLLSLHHQYSLLYLPDRSLLYSTETPWK